MFRKVMGSLCIICVASLTSGCAIFSDEIDKAASAGGRLVTAYCENTTADIREQIRQAVNEKAAPHSVSVDCAGP